MSSPTHVPLNAEYHPRLQRFYLKMKMGKIKLSMPFEFIHDIFHFKRNVHDIFNVLQGYTRSELAKFA